MAWNKWVDRFVRPLFDLIRPIPGLAWIPMFILLFGIGITSKALVIFLGALIACVVNSYTGIQQTQELHLWVGDVFGASNEKDPQPQRQRGSACRQGDRGRCRLPGNGGHPGGGQYRASHLWTDGDRGAGLA